METNETIETYWIFGDIYQLMDSIVKNLFDNPDQIDSPRDKWLMSPAGLNKLRRDKIACIKYHYPDVDLKIARKKLKPSPAMPINYLMAECYPNAIPCHKIKRVYSGETPLYTEEWTRETNEWKVVWISADYAMQISTITYEDDYPPFPPELLFIKKDGQILKGIEAVIRLEDLERATRAKYRGVNYSSGEAA